MCLCYICINLIHTYPSATNNWNRKSLKLKMFSICYLIPVLWTLFLIKEIQNTNWVIILGGKLTSIHSQVLRTCTLQKIFNVLIWVLSCWLRCKSPGLLVFSFPLKLYDRIFFILVDECTFSQVTNNHHQYVSWQIRHCCFQIALKADTDKTCRDVSLIREARVIIIKLHRDDQEWQTSALSTAKKKPGHIHVHLITQINSS